MCDLVVFLFHVIHAMFLQKLPRVIAEAADIPPTGTLRVRIGEGGRFTAVPYTTDSDRRIVLSSQAWREFHAPRHLEVGKAIVITLRTSHTQHLYVMLVLNYL